MRVLGGLRRCFRGAIPGGRRLAPTPNDLSEEVVSLARSRTKRDARNKSYNLARSHDCKPGRRYPGISGALEKRTRERARYRAPFKWRLDSVGHNTTPVEL